MRTTLIASLVALSLLPCAASAQMRPMSDNELSTVSGQGLFLVSHSNYNGFDFTRISLDADVTLNANLSNLRLGEYTYAPRNGTGADLDIGALQFGRTDGTAAQRLVQITNPYFEFVYKNTGVASQREIVGMRLGFDGIAGDVGMKIATLSGSMRIDAGAGGIIDSMNDAGGGKRWDGTCTGCTPLSQVGGVTAGDANGPSRDFWISILKTPVQFQAASGMPALTEAQAGIWLNWRDKLTALNLTGTVPANSAAGH
jgi:opacity protein-like surface antigen